MYVCVADLDIQGKFEGMEIHQLPRPLSYGWLDPDQRSDATPILQEIKASSQG